MRRLTAFLLILWVLAGVAETAKAFSLVGPAAPWMTQRLGYNLNAQRSPPGQGFGFGGPMNIGEEYRFNLPSLTYGFTSSFLNYFGQRGVVEVEKAIAILNALPSMDTVNINDYPLNSVRVNHRAEALLLYDVRSIALSALVSAMGITDPTRFVYTLRNRWTTTGPDATNYFVIKRNFDPDTWQHSSYINGQLWTYTQVGDVSDAESFVFTAPVDPLALNGAINAPVSSGDNGNHWLSYGGFWTGLTRDDVGGLRYIYRHDNYNVESAPTNSFAAGLGAVVSGGDSSPWTVPVISTNTGAGIPGASTNFIDSALRPGIGKIQFSRLTQESELGPFISNTVSYVDRYITNGVQRQQTLIRAQIFPDILFDAGDLQGGDGDPGGHIVDLVGSVDAFPSPTVDGTQTFGPGVFAPGLAGAAYTLTFNSVGPLFINGIINGVFFVDEATSGGRSFLWGSFDGSSEEPFIYPLNTNTELIEDIVLGGGGGGSSGSGSLVDVWTPSATILLPPGTTTGTDTGAGTTTP